jgi:hypothetical protein
VQKWTLAHPLEQKREEDNQRSNIPNESAQDFAGIRESVEGDHSVIIRREWSAVAQIPSLESTTHPLHGTGFPIFRIVSFQHFRPAEASHESLI